MTYLAAKCATMTDEQFEEWLDTTAYDPAECSCAYTERELEKASCCPLTRH